MATSPRRKLVSKRILPNTPKDDGRLTPSRSVTFNEDIVETSIGGTSSVSRMKKPLFPLDIANKAVKDRKSGSRISDTPDKTNGKENKKLLDVDSRNGQESVKRVPSFTSRFASRAGVCPTIVVSDSPFKTPVVSDSPFKTPVVSDSPFKTPPIKSRRHTLESKLFETPDCYRLVDLETPQKYDSNYDGETSTEDGEDSCDSITVAVRVRPFSQRELSDPNVRCVVGMNGNETTVTSESGTVHRFAYDFSFWSHEPVHENDDEIFSNQDHVYNQLAQPLLGKAFDGYNTCLFAYGQTGSGKSYSIMGHGEEVGIIPRFCEELFSRVELLISKELVKINVEISFFEIYNEKIHDLLASVGSVVKDKSAKKSSLKVREHPVLGPYVEGLSTYVVNSFDDVEGWITLGNKNRATASTGMNDKSSRSHSVFTIVLTQSKTERIEGTDHEHCTNSKINLVDLAGSERQSLAQTTGERLREGANINKSLMALGKVISLLSEQSTTNKKRKIFIPYRDSVLTWLLKESLGGNSKTAMIATISPANHHVEETLSTLRYAKQARSIVNVVRVNEDPKSKLIRELRAEIEKLKRDTSRTVNDDEGIPDSSDEIHALKNKLLAKERELGDISRSWQERLEKSEKRKAEEARLLEKSGITLKVDNQLPNLVNLNEDPQLAELLLYILKEGQTKVGRMSPTSHHDIQLNGALIADNHCIINNVDSLVSITPIGDAPTYVNGEMITEPSSLHHGDRLVLGGDHYFRFNHPMEVKQSKSNKGQTVIKDFEFARQELIAAQDSRLQAELDEARKEAEAEMLQEIEKAKQEAELLLKSQKSNFEDKLADLEKALKEQSQESQKAQQSRQDTENLVNKLKQQKTQLEHEMLESKKKQQLESEAQHKSLKSYKDSPLIELLESERRKAEEKLAELKIKRAEAKSPFRLAKTPDKMSAKRDLYKVSLLVREANKISQYLKKKITFCREDVIEDNEVKPLIKVTNGNHNMCTFWTVRKLELKVQQMRDVYQNGGETDEEEVFNDPEDSWEKDSFISSPNNSQNSPVFHGYQKSPLPTSGKRRVSFHNNNSTSSLRRVSGSFSTSKPESDLSVFKLCKDMISTLTESFNDINFEESISDKVLINCQILKQTISLIMEQNKVTIEGCKDELTVKRHCITLVSTLNLLASNCTVWAALVNGKDSHNLRDLVISMSSHVKVIGNHVAMLLQGYENELSSLVQESGCKAIDTIYILCKLCGQLALANQNKMVQLQQLTDGQTNQLGHDVCQAFISGSDSHVDRSLQIGIKTLEDCELKAQCYSDEAASSKNTGDLAQNIEIAMSAVKILLQKCQEIQVEVDTSMRESSDSKPIQFYHINYRRSHTLVGQIQNMADSASILIQSTGPLLNGTTKEWRKVMVCAEMIQKCSSKLLSSSGKDDNKRDSSDSNDSDISVLSDTQMEQLEYAGQEVKVAMTTLINQAQKHTASNFGTPSRATPLR